MAFQPMPLGRRPAPFDHPDWVFELKYDGFRSLCVIDSGRVQFISRNGHPFNSFTELQKGVKSPYRRTVIDGEIVCLDKKGRPQFRDLLFHRGDPCFFAFDLLMSDGKDMRLARLTDRKQELRRILPDISGRVQYADHVEERGVALFHRACQLDLEGVVAKQSFGVYVTESQHTTWFKIRNHNYSQMQGREELFERERHKEPVPGWHTCDLACAEAEHALSERPLGNCEIEYAAAWSDQGLPCGKVAVTRCAVVARPSLKNVGRNVVGIRTAGCVTTTT